MPGKRHRHATEGSRGSEAEIQAAKQILAEVEKELKIAKAKYGRNQATWEELVALGYRKVVAMRGVEKVTLGYYFTQLTYRKASDQLR